MSHYIEPAITAPSIAAHLGRVNWEEVVKSVNLHSGAIISKVVSAEMCGRLVSEFNHLRDTASRSRKPLSEEFPGIVWREDDLGKKGWGKNGFVAYYDSPLPNPIWQLQAGLYEEMRYFATKYAEEVRLGYEYPYTYAEFTDLGVRHGKEFPASIQLEYTGSASNGLHIDVYPNRDIPQAPNIYFPWQAVFVCHRKDVDYEGGDFIVADGNRRTGFSNHRHFSPDIGDLVIFPSFARIQPGQRKAPHKVIPVHHGMAAMRSGRRNAVGVVVGNCFYESKSRDEPLVMAGRNFIQAPGL